MAQFTTAGPTRSQQVRGIQVLRKARHMLGETFRINRYSHRKGWIFGFAERAAGKWEDGKKWKDHGGITRRQFDIIVQTSHSEDEAAQRVVQLIIHKNDTTRYEETQEPEIKAADIKRMVAESISEILRDKLAELKSGDAQVDEIAAKAAEKAVESERNPVPDGDPYDNPKIKEGLVPTKGNQVGQGERQLRRSKEYDLWDDRAKVLGIDPPTLRRDGNIDGRWKRHVEKLWNKKLAGHLQKKKAEAEQAPKPQA